MRPPNSCYCIVIQTVYVCKFAFCRLTTLLPFFRQLRHMTQTFTPKIAYGNEYNVRLFVLRMVGFVRIDKMKYRNIVAFYRCVLVLYKEKTKLYKSCRRVKKKRLFIEWKMRLRNLYTNTCICSLG